MKIVWVGDGNNVSHSWINAAAVLGLHLVLSCPEGYLPNPDILKSALAEGCGKIELVTDPAIAVTGADVVYTDVWTSMGQETEQKVRKAAFAPYQINASLLAKAPAETIVMHCLPAHRGEEISEEGSA